MLDIDRTNFGVDKNIGLIKKKKKKEFRQLVVNAHARINRLFKKNRSLQN